MTMAEFSDKTLALIYRGENGGWLFQPDDSKSIFWFSIAYTPSAIFRHAIVRHSNGKLF